MANGWTKLRVFVASPGDTPGERECLRRVIDEINRGLAADRRLLLELVRWETHSWPGSGIDAQDVINQEIEEPDILVCVLWKRLGTPTARAASGTAEEFDRAFRRRQEGRRVELLLYFNQESFFPGSLEEIEQAARVLAFRKAAQEKGLLVWEYRGTADFEAKVREHLTQVIRHWNGGEPEPERREADRSGGETWRQQLARGKLQVKLDPKVSSQAYALISALDHCLREKGFTQRSIDRGGTILWELLTNVARHAPESMAAVEIAIETDRPPRVELGVTNQGAGFDLEAILKSLDERMKLGEREHGLARVRRLAHELSSYTQKPGWHFVRCDFYEQQRPQSVFDGFSWASPVILVNELPKVLWLGDEDYVGREVVNVLHGAVRRSIRPLLHSYMGRLAQRPARYLCVEGRGGKIVTETPPPFFDTVRSALETYFPEYFQNQKVILLAGPDSQDRFVEWAKDLGLLYFDSEAECRRALEAIDQDRLPSPASARG